MKYIIKKSIRNLKKHDFFKLCTDDEIKEKEKVLSYLKSFSTPSAYTSQPAVDIVTNDKICDADNAFSDNEYTWYTSWIYHFEKYNLKLNDDFIEYVLSHS